MFGKGDSNVFFLPKCLQYSLRFSPIFSFILPLADVAQVFFLARGSLIFLSVFLAFLIGPNGISSKGGETYSLCFYNFHIELHYYLLVSFSINIKIPILICRILPLKECNLLGGTMECGGNRIMSWSKQQLSFFASFRKLLYRIVLFVISCC